MLNCNICLALNLKISIFIFLFILFVPALGFRTFQYVDALGTWAGKDSILVPISWCAVRGSPAFENPNIPNSYGGADTSTDQVLLKRGERVTDYIYINHTGIGFRSAINNALHTSSHFPNITDPLSIGPPGNLTVTHHGLEYSEMLNNCESAWANMTINNSGAVNGLFALNIRLFFDEPSRQETDATGIGYCSTNSSGYCEVPYEGDLAVVDNYFMIPGVLSGKYNDDPFDEALGHELGHTLSLQHRNWDVNALMNTNQEHNGPNAFVSNIAISSEEVNSLRNSTMAVPGVEIDPQNNLIQGDAVQSIGVDKIHENKALKPFDDLSSVKVSLDKKHNITVFGQQLLGLIPQNIKNNEKYWTLVDLDNDKKTGSTESVLHEIGVPPTKFLGADLIILSEANFNNATGRAWTVKGKAIDSVSPNLVKSEIKTIAVHLDTARITHTSKIDYIPLYNTINVVLNGSKNIVELNKPFSIQALISSNGTTVDRLQNENNDEGKTLELKQPLFPRCFVIGNAIKGTSVIINSSGLTPNSDIHAFLGPVLVGNGTTDSSGNGTIEFTIPSDTASGLHLVTVEIDNTALTADCVINIQNRTNIAK